MHTKRLFFLFIFQLLMVSLLLGQAEKIRFKHLTVDDGLSQNWVKCIWQDSQGFMWFGTGGNGVNKYDGYKCKVYKNDPTNKNTISDNWINAIYEDKKHRLWVGTKNGLNLYDNENDRFIPFSALQSETIHGFYESEDGKLYVIVLFNIYEINLEKKTAIPFCTNNRKCFPYNFVESIVKDTKGNFWLGSKNGLHKIDFVNKTFSVLRHDASNPKSINDNILQCIHRDTKGRIWIASTYNGLSLLSYENDNPNKPYFINFTHNPLDKNSISKGTIYSIIDDGNGKLWIGIENEGLDILDLKNFENGNYTFKHIKNNIYDQSSLANNSVHALYKDNQGTIWVGTYSGGVSYYNKLLYKFNHYKQIPNIANSLSNKTVNVFFEEGDEIWIGTEGGLNVINRKTGQFKNYSHNPNDPKSIGSNSIFSIFKDSRNNIWVGTWAGGLNLFNRENQTFTRFLHDNKNPKSISRDNVFDITEDENGYLWIAVMGGGLNRYDYRTNEFISYRINLSKKNSISNDWVQAVLESSKHELWVSTVNGVDIFNKKTGLFTNFKHDTANSRSISYNGANVIFEDSKKNIWLGTDNGLNFFVRKDSSFIYYREENGLSNNSIKGICEDKHGNLWLSTNYGISKFINAINLPEKPLFKNYQKNDGLQSNEFNRKAAYKTKDNIIFFGGINGFNTFYPDSIVENTNAPKVVINEFLLFNKQVEIGTKDSPLKKNIALTDELVLNYDLSVISFRFVALNFIIPEKNQYAYKLDGFEKNWNYVSDKREATYTNLNPGNYTFRVKASNNDGIWNEVGTSIKITILPPWWQTWWFRSLVFVAIASLIVFFINFRIRLYRFQSARLTEMVKERTKELEESNVFLEEKQEEINQQNEELTSQRDALEKAYNILEEQKAQIVEQNKELDRHRNELEKLIEIRTHQLIQAKDKAEESDRLKSSFLANLSHEIRTPLNAIIGFSGLVFEDNYSDEEILNFQGIIRSSSDTLLSLINDIIDFSKIESGHIDIMHKEISLSKVMNEIEEIYELQIKRQQMEVKHDLMFTVKSSPSFSNIIIETDEIRLKQIITNLINNAIKFTSEGFVEVGCNILINNNMVEFYVKDSGIGIKNENQKIIFDRFRKVEDDNEILHRGAGIGLSISQQLVMLLGGQIRVESDYGIGSTFYFTIPIKSNRIINNEPLIKVAFSEIIADFKNAKVLVAEDDLTNFSYLEKLLQKFNVNVIHAVNGIQVLDLIANTPDIRLILMDIKMPVLNGIETLHQIRQTGYNIPIVAQTAYALAHEIIKLKEEGFNDYISKPLRKEDISMVLNKWIKLK